MSEPLNAVTERDVLSSIRRLVAEDPRPAAVVLAPKWPTLILTADLRIAAPDPATPPGEDVLPEAAAEAPVHGWESQAGQAPSVAAPDWADGQAAEPEISIDEEFLRDLVRDLIREELQGHLGERITRNIRSLVRAEIAEALAATKPD